MREPPPTPARPASLPTLVGCFIDSSPRDLPVNAGDLKVADSPVACAAECTARGSFEFIGLQNGNNCFCGHTYGSHGAANISDCNMPCPGDKTIMCG